MKWIDHGLNLLELNKNILTARVSFLKIILNVDAITYPITGIGQYTLQLGQELLKCQQVEEVKFFSADHWVDDISVSAEANKWLGRLRQWVPFKSMALNQYAKRRAKKFKQRTEGMDDRLFHSPNFVLMPFAGKSVATFHDLSFVHYRETQPKYRLQFLDREIPKTLAQADALITPSMFIKQEIIEHYGYPADSIHVTALGVDAGFKPYDEKTCALTLQKYRLKHKQYVLSVATTEPRKNLKRLLMAYTQLPETLRTTYPMVLVGSKGWLDQGLQKQIKKRVNDGQIISLGYVSQTELQHLYAAAKLTAFPSLYEGFGLPIIESMASGTPVLTSQNSAMQEVASGHAMLCDPEDINSIEVGLRGALEIQEWQQQATIDGINHSKNFTWNTCAKRTVEAYKSINC
jgi:glycosyltransferase involved in cell wall biosynthesis